jgi:hypothetical protein
MKKTMLVTGSKSGTDKSSEKSEKNESFYK